jgi:hypothetical protein
VFAGICPAVKVHGALVPFESPSSTLYSIEFSAGSQSPGEKGGGGAAGGAAGGDTGGAGGLGGGDGVAAPMTARGIAIAAATTQSKQTTTRIAVRLTPPPVRWAPAGGCSTTTAPRGMGLQFSVRMPLLGTRARIVIQNSIQDS